MHTVHESNIFTEFHSDQFLVRLFSISFCMTYFFFLEGVAVASYADDTTLYSASKTNDLVIKEVEHFPKFFLNGLTLTT